MLAWCLSLSCRVLDYGLGKRLGELGFRHTESVISGYQGKMSTRDFSL